MFIKCLITIVTFESHDPQRVKFFINIEMGGLETEIMIILERRRISFETRVLNGEKISLFVRNKHDLTFYKQSRTGILAY